MLRRLLIALCVTGITLPLYADEKPNPAATPAEKDKKRHQDFLQDIKKKDGKIDDVVLGDPMADDGTLTAEIMPDYLHLSQEGYQIWADSIRKELEAMTK